ncbi:hypothetical protein TrST_g7774 [Triparma strigata]|uniref:G10 protein n=1 Tax=Triparma strigata TaxID=1606541 RepID=A0A9W7EYC2_9STRA|nr:hypothetical protein TrST_g7774 [Triparma strigata]
MSHRGPKPPPGFSYLQPTLTALSNELRTMVNRSHEGLRKSESNWPIIQITNQRSRYVYDMYYLHKKIDRKTYDYCIRQKIADAALIAKWKKGGYEMLCSNYVITPSNYKFGGVSICRVPKSERREKGEIQDPNTGCTGCASGDVVNGNIFGNKYGQRLAGIQIAREERRKKKELEDAKNAAANPEPEDKPVVNEGDSETDDSDSDSDDDFGPARPAPAEAWGDNEENEQGLKLTSQAEEGEEEEEEEGPSKKKQRN